MNKLISMIFINTCSIMCACITIALHKKAVGSN